MSIGETCGWVIFSCEVSECWWKFVIETFSSCEVSECWWKFINWLVEVISSCEMVSVGSLLLSA
jgi:hypothetical protein